MINYDKREYWLLENKVKLNQIKYSLPSTLKHLENEIELYPFDEFSNNYICEKYLDQIYLLSEIDFELFESNLPLKYLYVIISYNLPGQFIFFQYIETNQKIEKLKIKNGPTITVNDNNKIFNEYEYIEWIIYMPTSMDSNRNILNDHIDNFFQIDSDDEAFIQNNIILKAIKNNRCPKIDNYVFDLGYLRNNDKYIKCDKIEETIPGCDSSDYQIHCPFFSSDSDDIYMNDMISPSNNKKVNNSEIYSLKNNQLNFVLTLDDYYWDLNIIEENNKIYLCNTNVLLTYKKAETLVEYYLLSGKENIKINLISLLFCCKFSQLKLLPCELLNIIIILWIKISK